MTLLSITASFGALVFIFQDGNFSNILGFQTPGFTIAGNPIIMFSVLFGLSMDYEVLLLSRMQEAYRRTGDNTASVAEGLAKTAGVITGAALIMVSVFSAFALADSITIKSIGVGMAIAVLIDATIVRILLVPATMRLLGKWNWWAPGPLGRFADRLGLQPRRGRARPGAGGGRDGVARGLRGPARDTIGPVDSRAMATRIPPPDENPSGVSYYAWRWGSDEQRRPGLPWIGIFLVVFGGLLLLEQAAAAVPRPRQHRDPGRRHRLAHRLGDPARHDRALRRRVPDGARRCPGRIEAATGTNLGPGWGTLCFGLAFLFIAAVRAVRGGGWGWQRCGAAVLLVLGASEILQPDISGIALPLILVAIGRPAPRPGAATGADAGRAPRGRRLDRAPPRASAIRTSSSSVTTNGGPSRIVSPSTPFALPVPE